MTSNVCPMTIQSIEGPGPQQDGAPVDRVQAPGRAGSVRAVGWVPMDRVWALGRVGSVRAVEAAVAAVSQVSSW